MREGWEYKKLGEVATFINGYPFKPSDWKDSGRKIIRIQNLNNPDAVYNYYDGDIDTKFIISKGDVLISWSGSLGVYEWSDEEAILNQHIFKVVFNKGEINKRFFEYVVSSRINEMKMKVHGITMQHITKRDFDIIPVPVPPLSEQQRIVSELDLLSSIIEKKKAQLKEYDQLAQSIFFDMFGDPITNEKGWEVKKLGEVYKLKSGDGLSAKQFVDGQYPVYGGNGISGFHNSFNMDGNYIIIGRVGAYCGNVRNVIGKFWLTDNAFQLIYDIKRQNPIFVKFVLTYLDLHQYANHAAQPVISNISLKEIKVPYPPLSLQQSFAEKIEAIEKQKTLVQQSLVETQTMFDYTMDKYFG